MNLAVVPIEIAATQDRWLTVVLLFLIVLLLNELSRPKVEYLSRHGLPNNLLCFPATGENNLSSIQVNNHCESMLFLRAEFQLHFHLLKAIQAIQ